MKLKNIENPTRLIYHNPVSLVTSNHKEIKNVFTVSWLCSVSNHPPMVMISVDKKRFSFNLIKQSGKFVINIPNIKMIKDVIYCGNVSRKNKDKFEERNLMYSVSDKGGIILNDTIAYVECEVKNEFDVGDHILFIGEIITSGAEEEAYSNGSWNLKNENAKTLHFLGENGRYITIDEINFKKNNNF
ncbi:MAG: flavin reductase family protein [Patescibacteria group bacterium]|nr:flavin reductase family protein [Patescibacteria group bacterium]